jgi:hypothetical protein
VFPRRDRGEGGLRGGFESADELGRISQTSAQREVSTLVMDRAMMG